MRYMLGIIIFLSLDLRALESARENTQVRGEALVLTKPDYIVMRLQINSECQKDPKKAQRATDEISKKIDEYINKLNNKEDKYFKITVDGGFSAPFSRWIKERSSNNNNNQVEICSNTFQKLTNIIIKIGMRPDFDELFSGLQDFVFKQFNQERAEDIETPRSYVSIQTPQPEITREHRIALERQALDLAVRDAKANFLALIKSCEPHRYKIISIRENNNSYAPKATRAFMQQHAAEAQIVAPVRFDNIEISKSVIVSFDFDGALCFER